MNYFPPMHFRPPRLNSWVEPFREVIAQGVLKGVVRDKNLRGIEEPSMYRVQECSL